MIPVWKLRDTFSITEDGKLIWRTGPRTGYEAGHSGRLGYRRVEVLKERLQTHRIIWAMTHGAWPAQWVDHKDGDPTNNRPSNLREASPAENTRNRKRPRTNTSGVKGVCWEKNKRKWQVHIRVDGHKKFVGFAADLTHGAAMYADAAKRFHGEFACLTR